MFYRCVCVLINSKVTLPIGWKDHNYIVSQRIRRLFSWIERSVQRNDLDVHFVIKLFLLGIFKMRKTSFTLQR